MTQTNDSQVATILARGVARVRAVANDNDGDIERDQAASRATTPATPTQNDKETNR